ncbi:MAG TPA: NADH-ubiquinone oxidoreductase-F iron-sulfur binding region domain-containing protein, partial [Candidatus Limnocylindrales bacterium]|nr:NADH-ubiquinone oxidoreductase-F iron-sulfur binding region domain-containing protein [Candidatus Limnocylindrales bacterium]
MKIDLELITKEMTEKNAGMTYQVLVCCGTGCIATGAMEVYKEFLRQLDALDNQSQVELSTEDVCLSQGDIKQVGCKGFCQIGPLVTIHALVPGVTDIFYCHVKPEDVQAIVETSIVGQGVVQRLLYRHPQTDEPCRNTEQIPFYAKQKRLVLTDCGIVDPEQIEEYIARGGYATAQRIITKMTPLQVCQEMLLSGLRGRGGAGFPTGRKWQATLEANGSVKHLVCNGDEGDPGAFMNRSLMEGDPHRVLEGALVAAYATGASRGYFYIRMEYPLAMARMKKAIVDAQNLGLIGSPLFGKDFIFECEVVEGAGAFVCGEETALLASIEGQRGMPRPKPPFPAQSGLFGEPTVVNNVETLGTVRTIFELGVANFLKIGSPKNPGTKTFALTGHVRNNGLIEVPLGITLREIIYDIGGGVPEGRKFKAVQIGGPSGGCLGAEHLDLPVDYDSLSRVGAMMGSGGMVVLDDTACMVEIARFFMQFTKKESCGKCIPCREGTKQLLEILQDITAGKAKPGDLEILAETGRV